MQLWATDITLAAGDFRLSYDLGHWVNDGLMTLFFLLVGMELRREFDMGEFRERRRVQVPVIAALGGMLLPVAIFLAITPAGEAARGWAMVMATDTAFAVGVLALVGRRSSLRLRIFLLTLVIVDDVAAISVIAVVHSTNVQPLALVAGVALLGAMVVLRRIGAGTSWIYVALAWGSGWPPRPRGASHGGRCRRRPADRRPPAAPRVAPGSDRRDPSVPPAAEPCARGRSCAPHHHVTLAERATPARPASLDELRDRAALRTGQRRHRPERRCVRPPVCSPLAIGVIAGLVVGKTLDIPAGAWLATRSFLGGLPLSVGWPSLIAASSVAGIGFTVSLLIADLSYTGVLLEDAKLGILAASIVAALLSIVMFYGMSLLPRDRLRRAEART